MAHAVVKAAATVAGGKRGGAKTVYANAEKLGPHAVALVSDATLRRGGAVTQAKESSAQESQNGNRGRRTSGRTKDRYFSSAVRLKTSEENALELGKMKQGRLGFGATQQFASYL